MKFTTWLYVFYSQSSFCFPADLLLFTVFIIESNSFVSSNPMGSFLELAYYTVYMKGRTHVEEHLCHVNRNICCVNGYE